MLTRRAMKITNLDEAIRAYNQIEDARDKIRIAYNDKDSRLKKAMELIEQFMLQEMKNLNLSAYSVPGQGTAKKETKRRFGGADWALIWQYVVENNCPNILQKRLLDSEIQQILDTTGNLPPGVNTDAKFIIKVVGRE
jgi:hypothetical protein